MPDKYKNMSNTNVFLLKTVGLYSRWMKQCSHQKGGKDIFMDKHENVVVNKNTAYKDKQRKKKGGSSDLQDLIRKSS